MLPSILMKSCCCMLHHMPPNYHGLCFLYQGACRKALQCLHTLLWWRSILRRIQDELLDLIVHIRTQIWVDQGPFTARSLTALRWPQSLQSGTSPSSERCRVYAQLTYLGLRRGTALQLQGRCIYHIDALTCLQRCIVPASRRLSVSPSSLHLCLERPAKHRGSDWLFRLYSGCMQDMRHQRP